MIRTRTKTRTRTHRTRYPNISYVASALGGMMLEETVRNGGTVTIPSLGIVLTRDNLRPKPPNITRVYAQQALHYRVIRNTTKARELY